MDNNMIEAFIRLFEKIIEKRDDNQEFIYLDDLQRYLKVEDNLFKEMIEKSKIACENAGYPLDLNFYIYNKRESISLGAASLIAVNGNPENEIIAFVQVYFSNNSRAFEIVKDKIFDIERIIARSKYTESRNLLTDVLKDDGGFNKNYHYINYSNNNLKETFKIGKLAGKNSSKNLISNKLELNKEEIYKPIENFLHPIANKMLDYGNTLMNLTIKNNGIKGYKDIIKEDSKIRSKIRFYRSWIYS